MALFAKLDLAASGFPVVVKTVSQCRAGHNVEPIELNFWKTNIIVLYCIVVNSVNNGVGQSS